MIALQRYIKNINSDPAAQVTGQKLVAALINKYHDGQCRRTQLYPVQKLPAHKFQAKDLNLFEILNSAVLLSQ